MSIKQLFKPDFWVCEWWGGIQYGQFAVTADTWFGADLAAKRHLDAISYRPTIVMHKVRKPTLVERWRAAWD